MNRNEITFVPWGEKPAGLAAAVVYLNNFFGDKMNPSSSYCWAYDVTGLLPKGFTLDSFLGATILIPSILSCGISKPIGTEPMKSRGYRQLEGGLIVPKEISRFLPEINSKTYNFPRELEIMDPVQLYDSRYFDEKTSSLLSMVKIGRDKKINL